MAGSLDNVQDALEALRRDEVTFLICVKRKSSQAGIMYHLIAELDGEDGAEWLAMLEAIRCYCIEGMSDE